MALYCDGLSFRAAVLDAWRCATARPGSRSYSDAGRDDLRDRAPEADRPDRDGPPWPGSSGWSCGRAERKCRRRFRRLKARKRDAAGAARGPGRVGARDLLGVPSASFWTSVVR